MAHSHFPHSWLGTCGEKKFPHSRLRRSWGNFFPHACQAIRGENGNVPFVTHEEFFIPIFVASPLIWEYPIPISLQTGIGSILTNFFVRIDQSLQIFCKDWPNPMRRRNREIGISPWITKGTLYFPHEWLSRNSENKFPHERRSREWGNFFLLWLLSHEWGKYYVPWVMKGEIYQSLFLLLMGFSFPC